MTNNKEVITGGDFRRMITGAYSEFLLEYENINALKAVSLADGGTAGTNILRTMGAAAAALADVKEAGIGALAKRAANGAVLGARGNAGVILAQLLVGIAKGLAGKYDVSSSVFGKSFQYGILYAQRVIPDREERPIITVAKAVAKGAYFAVRANQPISDILAAAIKAGEAAMDEVAAQQGFVDAGGRAMLVFLQGCLHGLDGNFVSPSLNFSAGFKTAHVMPDPRKDVVRPYCLALTVDQAEANVFNVERTLEEYGSLVVAAKRDKQLCLHLHTDHPGLVIEQAVGWGTLSSVKIDNMAEPHKSAVIAEAPARLVVLAVASDEAAAAELEDMGATVMLASGGSSSVGDFVNVVHSDLAEKYILLPNSKGLYLVMREVKRLLGSRVEVLDTDNMADQAKVLRVYRRAQGLAENVKQMRQALLDM